MPIPNDPVILLSYLNTKLRDQYPSLEEFARTYDVSMEELQAKLSAIGYEYDRKQNRFL